MKSLQEGAAKLLRSRKFLTAVGGAVLVGVSVGFNANPKVIELLTQGIALLIASWTVEDTARVLFSKK